MTTTRKKIFSPVGGFGSGKLYKSLNNLISWDDTESDALELPFLPPKTRAVVKKRFNKGTIFMFLYSCYSYYNDFAPLWFFFLDPDGQIIKFRKPLLGVELKEMANTNV